MGDADAFAAFNAIAFVAKGDNTMPVFKPDHAPSPQARRVEAREHAKSWGACKFLNAKLRGFGKETALWGSWFGG